MIPGIIAITIAFTASIVAITAYILYHRDGNNDLLRLGNISYYTMAAGIFAAISMLIYLIMDHNFQVNFVYSYSSTILNKFYLFATLWAGQEGTFLLFIFYGSIYGLILIATVARKQPLALVVLTSIQAFILLILLHKSPFSMIWHIHAEAPIGFTPVDGAGLNPLLQNPWMVIHPPTLFVGYSSTMVPFALAMSGMMTRSADWIKSARPWIVFNVMVLGTGLIMGGYWAYTTLGWGGYWAWDPVENASLVPWLFGIVLLHSVIIQGKRGSLVRTNMLLAGMVFLTMVWGSFLTRSGVLTDFSVHSFAESGLNMFLITWQLLYTGLFFFVFFNFVQATGDKKSLYIKFPDGVINRETFMWFGMMVILFTAVVVLFGTSSPLYTGLFGSNPWSVPPEFYNSAIIPVAVFMLVTVAIGPLLAWKTSELRNKSTILWSAVSAIVLTLGAVALGLTDVRSIVLFLLSTFVIIINLKVAGLFILRNTVKSGGYIAHVGLGFMIIGILTSSIYDSSEKVVLPQGEPTKTEFGYEVQFMNFVDMPDGRDRVKLLVKTDYGSYEAYPHFYYSDYSNAYMIAPDVKPQFSKDIYISPISFTPSQASGEETLSLHKGESASVRDITIQFHDFTVNMGSGRQEVTANLTASWGEGAYVQSHDLHPIIIAQSGKMDSQPVEVPGTAYAIRINSVNATDGSVDLAMIIPREDGQEAKDMLAVEVSEKPLISILWFGTIIFIGGIMVTLIGLTRDYRKK